MDLTKIVLPTFILERRSLLEMYADFFVHPEIFTDIARKTSQEERMIQVLSSVKKCCVDSTVSFRCSSGTSLRSVPAGRATMPKSHTIQFLVKFSNAGGLYRPHLV